MHGHVARKRFGQNFLADPHYTARIVDAVDPRPGENIVEIGPGLAAITGGLIERAGHITAIEIDRDLAARLREQFTPAQLTLHEADALEFDFATLAARPARRRQPALQHQLAAALPSRDVRRPAARPACDAAAGGRGADDGGARHRRLRPADRHAAGEIRDQAPVRRAARRVPAGAQGRIRHRASRAARRRQAADRRPARCSRASSPPRSGSAARRCAMRCPRCATRRRCGAWASTRAVAARHCPSANSCGWPTRSPRGS